MRLILIATLFPLICHGQTRPYVFSSIPRVEMIYGFNLTEDNVQIRVESRGCTDKASFFVQKTLDPELEIVNLQFVRIKPDWCKGYFKDGTVIEFSRLELNLDRRDIIKVDNPFGSKPEEMY